jgi:probable F420-dependent oxidoreductase
MYVAAGLGLFDFPFSGPRQFWQWVDLCEAGGVDSLWQSDRLVGDQPMLECMSAMAALAGATRRMKFGMNVISVALRDPILIARQCATVDMLSEGRLLPGFGIGSPHSRDWSGTGTPTRGRGRRTDEALDIIAALWRGERVTAQGEFFRCDDAVIAPLPVQQPLPLWIGGSSDAAIRRTARIGTGWMGGRETPEQAGRVVRGVTQQAAALGRRVPADHFGASFYFRLFDGDGAPSDRAIIDAEMKTLRARFPDRDPATGIVTGSPGAIVNRIQEFLAVGVSKFVLRPLASGDEDVLTQTRRFVEQALPAIDALNARA